MKPTLKTTLVAALTLTLVACASTTALQVSSLRDQSVATADAAPAEKAYPTRRPGEMLLIARTFATQPPLIPHSTEGYSIGPEENDCLECHISDDFKGKKMPMVPKSHLVKSAKADADPELNMLRYQCDSCHVPQVDAPALVANDFKGLAAVKR